MLDGGEAVGLEEQDSGVRHVVGGNSNGVESRRQAKQIA